MGKPEEVRVEVPDLVDTGGGIRWACPTRSLVVLALGVCVLLPVIFWIPPFRARRSVFVPDDPDSLHAEIQASFILQKPISQLAADAARLEYDIFEEIGIPNTKILENIDRLMSELKFGLNLRSYENVYVKLMNADGSTVAPPVTVEASVLSDVGSGSLLPDRMKQLAQVITGPDANNLGLNNSVFGKVKQVQLSSYLKHSILSLAPGPSPSPSPSPPPPPPSPSPSNDVLYPVPPASLNPTLSPFAPAPSNNQHRQPPCFYCQISPSESPMAYPPAPQNGIQPHSVNAPGPSQRKIDPFPNHYPCPSLAPNNGQSVHLLSPLSSNHLPGLASPSHEAMGSTPKGNPEYSPLSSATSYAPSPVQDVGNGGRLSPSPVPSLIPLTLLSKAATSMPWAMKLTGFLGFLVFQLQKHLYCLRFCELKWKAPYKRFIAAKAADLVSFPFKSQLCAGFPLRLPRSLQIDMGYTKDELLARLKELQIDFVCYDHPAVLTVEAQAKYVEHLGGALSKNLLLKDKKHRYYVVSALANTNIDLKGFPLRLPRSLQIDMGYTKDELLARLKELQIDFVCYDHPAVLTVEAQAKYVGHLGGALSKNLLLKDKKHRYYVVSALANTNIDLKVLSQRLGLGKGGLRMAAEEALQEILQVPLGCVTPLALINESARDVSLLLDQGFKSQESCYFHPLTNEVTLSISANSLDKFLISIGRQPSYVDLEANPAVGKDNPPDLASLVASGIPTLPDKVENAVTSIPTGNDGLTVEKPTKLAGEAKSPAALQKEKLQKVQSSIDPLAEATNIEKLVKEIMNKTSTAFLNEVAEITKDLNDSQIAPSISDVVKRRVSSDLEHMMMSLKNAAYTQGFQAGFQATLRSSLQSLSMQK
ncbi:hypothetical protein MUK42_20485 [Musa troglodytarum]|uniref:YbaK/aminoacyl-tRNA synthetase-associated domain-containing protein n=1 Tax=Musa troglodytarum TaxID=320322 RepID=A0A9E7G2K0_9LILI|nr:hypothetical protein MUK42_20485 [Musa troglodytarum]